MRIKLLLIITLAFFSVAINYGCKKTLQEKYEDILVKMMTNGSWKITSFKEGGTDITSAFNGWAYTFLDNGTMAAVNGVNSQSGTWSSDIQAKKFTAQFSNPVDPIQKLNGTWYITSATQTIGKFTQTKNGTTYEMELVKN